MSSRSLVSNFQKIGRSEAKMASFLDKQLLRVYKAQKNDNYCFQIVNHFNLKRVYLFGVGVGANILLRFSVCFIILMLTLN